MLTFFSYLFLSVLSYEFVDENSYPSFDSYAALLNNTEWVQPSATLDGISLVTVNYHAIAASEIALAHLNETITAISASRNESELNRAEFLALYINAYNVYAIHTVLSHSCELDIFGACSSLSSIRDAGSLTSPVWKDIIGKVSGREMSLDDIEHVLRSPASVPAFANITEDARIHAAIVCASISCPNLQPWPYLPDSIDEQLTRSMTEFLANPKKGLHASCKADGSAATVRVSSIFNWFAADFVSASGSVSTFLATYAPGKAVPCLDSVGDALDYFEYNWSLNGKPLACAADRPCYPVSSLIGTLVAIMCCCACTCIVRLFWRRRRANYVRFEES